jgi:hypothetical protein
MCLLNIDFLRKSMNLPLRNLMLWNGLTMSIMLGALPSLPYWAYLTSYA